jgi:hypothetical protein
MSSIKLSDLPIDARAHLLYSYPRTKLRALCRRFDNPLQQKRACVTFLLTIPNKIELTYVLSPTLRVSLRVLSSSH